MPKPRIITSFVYPPIPMRYFDWCAYRDGYEEPGNPCGWGSTEQIAIDDLLEQEEEDENWSEWCDEEYARDMEDQQRRDDAREGFGDDY